MLKKLELKNVGPAARLVLDPIAPRFNLIAGDNGLGKSFLLETAWWALTRTWHETPAVPASPNASIGFDFDGDTKLVSSVSNWDPEAQQWRQTPGRPPNPGLVLYARVDGSFSAWDPARNYRLYRRADGGESESPAAYQFTSSQVLDGLRRVLDEGLFRREQLVCAGLIDDWTRWQDTNAPQFQLLTTLLEYLAPGDQPLTPGTPIRPSIDDARRIPTIRMPYGVDVPVTYSPAGVKRMCQLAYLLAWTLSEHEEEGERIGQPLSRQVIVLIDEPETHLHPRWQRTVLPGVAKAIENWKPEHRPDVQFIVATHSPLVLASMEPEFDPEKDALWKMDLVDGQVQIERDMWHPRGDVNRWLTSDVFDMASATSPEVESILKRAGELLAQKAPASAELEQVDAELGRLLPEMDPFFVRWRYYMNGRLAESSHDSARV